MDFTDLLSILEKYSVVIGSTSYSPLLFIWTLLFLFVIFYIRIIFYLRIDRKYKRKSNRSLLIWQQFLCYIVSVVTSFSLTCIFENSSNYILNGLICPAIGFIVSLIFENKVLNKYSEDSSSLKSNSFNHDKSSNNITLNINDKNINETGIDDESIHEKFSQCMQKPKETDFLSEDEMKSEDHNFIIKDKINDLIESRYAQASEITNIHEELKTQTNILNTMCESMKDDKKLKLEKMINTCLNQGFAAPEQNKIITTNYRNYRALRGNGDIEELYKNHYLKLEVHEDRRKTEKEPQNPSYIIPAEIYDLYRNSEDKDPLKSIFVSMNNNDDNLQKK